MGVGCTKCKEDYVHGSCYKCKALNKDGTCQLGFKTSKGRPLEVCPKPTTYLKLMEYKE
jgi:hypothetical protein